MFKTTQIIVLAALCLNFCIKAQAQTPTNQAIDVTTKGIQIGQKIPENTALSKYQDKFIILDFWATWCSPCVAMIPKMEALQAQFKNQVQILPVTYQTDKEVTAFLSKLQKGKVSNLQSITSDKELHKLFPHVYLPHYVWIDQGGTVKAITGLEEITAPNIEKMLSTPAANLKQKKDMKIAYNKAKPFLIKGNGGNGSGLIYHAVFNKYVAGIRAGYTKSKDSSNFTITARNESIPKLLALAYAESNRFFPRNRIKLEVADTTLLKSNSKGPEYESWLSGHSYCYELIVPQNMEKQAYKIMQQDLNRFIPNYSAAIEKKTIRCLTLVKTSKVIKLGSKGGKPTATFTGMRCHIQNAGLTQLISRLDAFYLQDSPLPVVNATGYTGPVDLDINASLSDVNAMNRELKKYGLKFTEADFPVEMLIVKDKK